MPRIDTVATEVFTLSELKELHPDGYTHALEVYQDARDRSGEFQWRDEILASLKACVRAANLDMGRDWEIGPYAYSHMNIAGSESAMAFTGARAMAWIENRLLGKLRIPFTGAKRWKLAKHGEWYRPGMIEPCPFTGVCFDDDAIASVLKAIREGETIKDAFNGLADWARETMEAECEWERSEEAFVEQADGLEYTAEGDVY